MSDLRFQPPSEKPQLNFEKTKERHIYADIKDYDEDNKRMAADLENIKINYYSKSEVKSWFLGIVAGNFLLIGGAIWSVSGWVTKMEARQSDSEKVGDKVLQVIDKESDRQDAFRQEIRDRVKALEVKSDK